MNQVVEIPFNVLKNLVEEAGTDGFAGMNGNYCAATVRMTKEVVAAFDANDFKTSAAQSG